MTSACGWPAIKVNHHLTNEEDKANKQMDNG